MKRCLSVILASGFLSASALVLTAVAAPGGQESQSGRILKVGPGEEFANPSDAARAVRSGDTVKIASGTYVDCAVWPRRVSNLTIEGQGAVIADRTCSSKGLFVVDSSDVVIRGITFKGAKVKDHNGAGIRIEGKNVTVENSRFIDNENGILTNNGPTSTVTVRNSYFEGNGTCIAACGHGIYAGHLGLLRVEKSEFVGQHEGHHVKSRALRTELVDNTIHDGPAGNASYLVDVPNGGDVLITGNALEKGPNAKNHSAAIVIGEESEKRGANPTSEIRIENNSFRNDLPNATTFVRNLSSTAAALRGNKLEGSVKPLDGPGNGA
jgi:hypothetical protein